MKRYLSLAMVLALLMTFLTGCGGVSYDAPMSNSAMMENSLEAPMAMDMAAGNSLTTNSSGNSSTIPDNRKWIITVDMSAETEDLEVMLEALDETIRTLNGYVEAQNVYNGSGYSSHRYRYANLTVRIPAKDVDLFAQEVSGVSNVVRTNKNLEDITLSYTDTASRIKALEVEEERLLDFMAQAVNMSDLLEIEDRLTDVRYELERYSSQLRLYDNQIDYATIYLSIEEVQEYTPVEEETVWERISGGFISSLKGVGEDLVDLLVWVIVSSPYLMMYGVIGLGVFLGVKKIRRRTKMKKQKKTKSIESEQKEN